MAKGSRKLAVSIDGGRRAIVRPANPGRRKMQTREGRTEKSAAWINIPILLPAKQVVIRPRSWRELSAVQVAMAMINWGRNCVESVCRCATLNADAADQFSSNPNSRGLSIRNESQIQHKRQLPRVSAFKAKAKRRRLWISLFLVQSRRRWRRRHT